MKESQRSTRQLNPNHPKTQRQITAYFLYLRWLKAGREAIRNLQPKRRGPARRSWEARLTQWTNEAHRLAEILGFNLAKDQREFNEVILEMSRLLGALTVSQLLIQPTPWQTRAKGKASKPVEPAARKPRFLDFEETASAST